MVEGWPTSEHVRDIRTPEDIAADQHAWEAANYPKLVQFPEVEVKPNRRKK